MNKEKTTTLACNQFVDSLFMLSNTTLTFSYFICISLWVKQVEVSFETKTGGAIQYLATDTGNLKVYGEGKRKVKNHGTDGCVEFEQIGI